MAITANTAEKSPANAAFYGILPQISSIRKGFFGFYTILHRISAAESRGIGTNPD
ncbi:MAG: hypothetical protein IJF78_16910 [Clostridia bacterium]|nr:hypothetical protein [Clostridia bacterium]